MNVRNFFLNSQYHNEWSEAYDLYQKMPNSAHLIKLYRTILGIEESGSKKAGIEILKSAIRNCTKLNGMTPIWTDTNQII